MKLGNNYKYFFGLIYILLYGISFAEEKISSTPLINLDNLKPSFEDLDEKNDNFSSKNNIKIKKKKQNVTKTSHAVLIGLDKITAKSSEIVVNLDEIKKFGPLEIKILRCEKIKTNNKLNNVAYMQVKDLTKNENDKVFIFNGWTFSSDPSLTPFDHAIYDLQLVSCYKV